jgi:anti-sigma regulatory factor (Ser/Thr protein kinase)
VAERSPGVLELEPGTMSNVSTARSFVRRTLEAVAPDEVVADLQLATSELVTNAFEHGEPRRVVVAVEVGDGCASVTIKSHQRAESRLADVSEWSIAGPGRLAGRGLGIVRAVADDVHVASEGDRLEVTVYRKW